MAEKNVTDWQIERHLLGELPPNERERVARALVSDEALIARAREIEGSNREILSAHPPRAAAAIIRERLRVHGPRSRSWRQPVLAFAASVAVIGAGLSLWRTPDPPDVDRIKGLRPSLLVFRRTPVGDEVLADRAVARKGDLVQVTYQAAGRPFGVIVSIDGRGVVTVHHPASGSQAARLVPGKPERLTTAYRLDDAPGWERFVLVTSERPFDVGAVVEAAQRLGTEPSAASERLSLPKDLDQSSFTLTKEDPR